MSVPPTSVSGKHVCWGCQKPIADFEPHIHFTLDEFSAAQGLEALGLDELLQFTLCHDCTEDSEHGWIPEAHEVERGGVVGE